MKNKLVLGIDDSSRCPVIASLVISGVLMEEDKLEELCNKVTIKDSKEMTRKQRFEAFPKIIEYSEGFSVNYIPATKISKINNDFNLNDMEAEAFEDIIMEFKSKKVILDNFEKNKENLIKRFKNWDNFEFLNVFIAENNADKDFPIVSCASILAKCFSDIEHTVFKEMFGDFGSGNPIDEKAVKFICQNANHYIIRKSWESWKRLESLDFDFDKWKKWRDKKISK